MGYARDHAQPGVKFYRLSGDVVEAGKGLPPVEEGMVHAVCWCERQFVVIPEDWAIQGLTKSCGHKECHA